MRTEKHTVVFEAPFQHIILPTFHMIASKHDQISKTNERQVCSLVPVCVGSVLTSPAD